MCDRGMKLLRGLVITGVLLGIVTSAVADHPLFQAIRRDQTDLLASILRQGTPVSVRMPDGTSPLAYAALRGSETSVRLLLEYGADPNVTNQAGVTALVWGVHELAKVRLLLEAGAVPDVQTRLGNTPLIIAAAHASSVDVVRLLLEHGADVHVANRRGTSALRNAVRAGGLETAKVLLSRGARQNAESNGASDLSLAAGRGDQQMVELLLAHDADPNYDKGRSALTAALLAQKPAIVKRLLEAGARLDRRLEPGGVPPVVLSAYSEVGDREIIERMIDKGVDLNVRNEHGETVLTWAKKRGFPQVLELLAKHEASDPVERQGTEIPERADRVDPADMQSMLKRRLQTSISLLQHSSDVFLEKRKNCVSCHHQNLPSVAIGWARERGLMVDEESIRRMIRGQLKSWRPRIERAYQMDRPVPVAPRFIGYGLLGFSMLGYPRDEVTDALVWYLAKIQSSDGHWVPGMLRPPLGGSEILATVLAMRSLQLYALEGREKETADRIGRARKWLQRADPKLQQEYALKLLGLGWAGVPATELADLVDKLVEEQRTDGGWAQLPGLDSDAWATGQALVALRVAGGVPVTHPVYQSGMRFLFRTQFPDGSWYVESRTWPFQTHFDSEFPYGEHQWISAPATAWASMALLLAMQPIAPVVDIDYAAAAVTDLEPSVLPTAPKPVVPAKKVDFVKQIQPILERSCVGCHAGTKPEAGFRITRREFLIAGGESDLPPIVPGQAAESRLLRQVADKIADLEMPPLRSRGKFPALTSQQVQLLADWINQGAKWPAAVSLKPAD
ncbi:MAG: ankyrin repeat domain-containing protein [Planctomycetota bacterium]|nr:ankyrin repeat domain-containing protein [Planctomycetota bacterium]